MQCEDPEFFVKSLEHCLHGISDGCLVIADAITVIILVIKWIRKKK